MKRQLTYLVLWIHLIWVWMGIPLAGADDSTPITGRVLDLVTGQPVVGVNMIVVGTHYGDATDKWGNFTIPGFPPGDVTLLASAIGYEDIQIQVQLPLDAPLTIRLRETFFQMDEVVITGTRTNKIFRNVPVATEVISRQDVLDSGARNMGELLEQRSGISINPGVEGGQTVNLLGIDSKYILIMVDGQPVTGKFNNRISLDQISTTIVDKVEIIKGPSSAMYGSEAMGGVINIITRRRMSAAPLAVRSRFTGSHEGWNPFYLDHGKRDFRLNLDQDWKNLRLQLDVDALWANVDKSIKYIDVDRYNKLAFRSDLTWQLEPTHVLDFRLNRFGTTEENLLRSQDFVAATTEIERSTVLLEHRWQVSPALHLNTVGRQDLYERQFSRLNEGTTKTRENEMEAEVNLVYETTTATVNTGAELGRDIYSNERVSGGSHRRDLIGIYLQAEWQPLSDLVLIIGARVDDNNEITPIYSPRLAAMYTLTERWKLRTSWGKGFRMPSFMDRYMDWSHLQYGYAIVGNLDLEHETSEGVNLGLEYYHPGVYQVNVIAYHNRFVNMIDDFLLEPGLFTYKNIGQVRFNGLEIQGRWNVSRSWLMSWGYNYVNNQIVKSQDLTEGEPVPNTQPHIAMMRLSHKHSGGRISQALKAKFIAPYQASSFDPELGRHIKKEHAPQPVVDYDVRVRLVSWLSLGIGMQNVLNYTDDEYGPFIGRTFYLELGTALRGG
ncbi:MAG: TonB-dependent receptor [Fidelibacterota bacterium]|nr:MAG: TonB-dependent receptor [Candidatus Neomarinimicrobiota bacterium]